ncbi:hypothetical protein BASA81_008105 [Batrachochytrium salamandrivorans]|nr:hypothetical protein BASA81_008105 [Batrachochytrium salamandrivorans]
MFPSFGSSSNPSESGFGQSQQGFAQFGQPQQGFNQPSFGQPAAQFGQSMFGQHQLPVVPFGQQQPSGFGQQQQQQQPVLVPFGQQFGQTPAQTNRSLFLHVPANCHPEEVRAYLQSMFGPVISIAPRPNHPAQLYAEMANAEDAQRAVDTRSHAIPGLSITFNKFAKPTAPAPPPPPPPPPPPMMAAAMVGRSSFDNAMEDTTNKQSTSLFIYLPPTLALDELRNYLQSAFGPVASLQPKPGNPLQAFAEMQSPDDAQRAVDSRIHPIKGLTINFNKFPRTGLGEPANQAFSPSFAPAAFQSQAMTFDDGMMDEPPAAPTAARTKSERDAQKAAILSRLEEKTRKDKSRPAAVPPATKMTRSPAPVSFTPVFPSTSTTPAPTTTTTTTTGNDEEFVVGTCTLMSPESETQARIDANQIDLLERSPNVFNTAIMKFQRSAANETMNNPEIIRTEDTLIKTLNYLWDSIVDIDLLPPELVQVDRRGNAPTLVSIMSFITDRTKRIRQELDMQGFTSGGTPRPGTIKILEECARFHILVSHELCEKKSDEDGFNAKLNREDMNACFKKLLALYDRGGHSQYELEMRAYYVVVMIDSNDWVSANTIVKTSSLAFRGQSELLDLALQVYQAFVTGDYFFYFSMLRNTKHYLLACLMHSGINTMRRVGLEMINGLHFSKTDINLGRFPVKRLCHQFCFDSDEECLYFLEHMAQLVICEGEYVILHQSNAISFAHMEKTRSRLIEAKREVDGVPRRRRDLIVMESGGGQQDRQEQDRLVVERRRQQEQAAAAVAAKTAAAASEAEAKRKQELLEQQQALEKQERAAAAALLLRQQEQRLLQERQRQQAAAAAAAAADAAAATAAAAAAAAKAAAQRELEAEKQRAIVNKLRAERLGTLLTNFATKRVQRVALRKWHAHAKRCAERFSNQVTGLHKLVAHLQLRRGLAKLAKLKPTKAYAFPMLFNASNEPPLSADADAAPLTKKLKRLSNGGTPSLLLERDVFPPQLCYCLIRFDPDLISCPVARFARWLASQMPNLVMITPETVSTAPSPTAIDVYVVVWGSKSPQEQEQVSRLVATAAPVVLFQLTDNGGGLVLKTNESSSYEIELPRDLNLVRRDQIESAVRWAQDVIRGRVWVSAFEFMASAFPLLAVGESVPQWLHKGNVQLDQALRNVVSLLPRLQLLVPETTGGIRAFAKQIGCPDAQFRRLLAQAEGGSEAWVWNQLVLLRFQHLAAGAQWEVSRNYHFQQTDASSRLLSAWGVVTATSHASPSVSALQREREASEAFERKLQAYLKPPPANTTTLVTTAAAGGNKPTITSSSVRLQAIAKERIKQEEFLKRIECARYHGHMWFTQPSTEQG